MTEQQNNNKIMSWARIAPVKKIQFFGWEYGHPVYNRAGTLIGYAANMPSKEGEEIEFIDLHGVVITAS